MVVDGDDVAIGTPTLSGVQVKTTVVDHFKGPKIIVFKYSPRKRTRVKGGHRQQYTRLMVDAIGKGKTTKAKKEKAPAKKTETKTEKVEKKEATTKKSTAKKTEKSPAKKAPAKKTTTKKTTTKKTSSTKKTEK
jgi:large subunit ribosomal protein L21